MIEMRKIIILTQYFPPETGAPQNRLFSVACYLHEKGFKVTVVTAMPNYPKNQVFDGYGGKMFQHEVMSGLEVERCWIFVSASRSFISRLLNYFSFVFTSFIKLVLLDRHDIIMCESPPLFLGITAVLIKKIKRSQLLFNVSDLWPESAEKMKIVKNKFILDIAYKLESWIYQNAEIISGQTKGIVKSIESRFPAKKVIWLPNGVDFELLNNAPPKSKWREELGISTSSFVVLYAGIIGHAQGLEVAVEAAHYLKDKSVQFIIVGDGPEKESLVALCESKGLKNVFFLPNMERKFIPGIIKECDIYLVPLKKLDLFRGAIPSKLFDPLSQAKPILLGVAGEAYDLFIKDGNAGLFYEPENAIHLSQQILKVYDDPSQLHQLGRNGFNYVASNFDRSVIHNNFLLEIQEVVA